MTFGAVGWYFPARKRTPQLKSAMILAEDTWEGFLDFRIVVVIGNAKTRVTWHSGFAAVPTADTATDAYPLAGDDLVHVCEMTIRNVPNGYIAVGWLLFLQEQ